MWIKNCYLNLQIFICILKINIWNLKMIFGSENWYFYSKIDISIVEIQISIMKYFIWIQNVLI